MTLGQTQQLTEERQGQIALQIFRYRAAKEGINISPQFRRELGNIAKSTGISLKELKEFYRIFAKEQAERTFRE